MAVLAVLAGVAVSFARPAAELRAANALKGLLLFARAQALWQGVPVSVTQLPLGSGFAVARGPFDAAGGCHGGEVTNRLLLTQYPGVRLTDGFATGGMQWLPSGSGRDCAGGGVISATLTLSSLTGAAQVVVSSLGRVRTERRP